MNSLNKTFLPTKSLKSQNWFIIDCQGQTLGRLASVISTVLKGKIKPHYHPAVDMGDYIILINADAIILNEKKNHFFVYRPGRPGHSLKIRSVSECLPKLTIEKAVKGMIAETEKKRLMRRLRIYGGDTHPHQAQNPIKLDLSNFYSNIQIDI